MSVTTLAEAKAYLRISWDTEDVVIQACLDGAEEYIEQYCSIQLSQTAQTNEVITADCKYYFTPSVLPIISIQHLYDVDDLTEDLKDEVFHNSIIVKYIQDNTFFRTNNQQYEFSYVGGYSSIPAGLKIGILQLTARMYENRSSKDSEKSDGYSVSYSALMNSDIINILSPYKSILI